MCTGPFLGMLAQLVFPTCLDGQNTGVLKLKSLEIQLLIKTVAGEKTRESVGAGEEKEFIKLLLTKERM